MSFPASVIPKAFLVLAPLLLSAPVHAQIVTPDNVVVDPVYYGQAGFNTVPGSIKLETTGDVKTPFLTREVTWARTGKSTEELKVSSTWGAIELPVGTRFYAVPFKDGFLSTQKKVAEDGFDMPDVAWCTPDYKPEKGDPLCFFTDLSWRENYGTSGAGSIFFPEYIGIGQYNKIFQSPKIKDAPVDFEQTLTLQAQINKIKKKTIKLEVQLFDGTEYSDIVELKADRDENGSATFELWGGVIEIVPADKTSFEIRQIQPFSSEISLDEERLLRRPYSLRT